MKERSNYPSIEVIIERLIEEFHEDFKMLVIDFLKDIENRINFLPEEDADLVSFSVYTACLSREMAKAFVCPIFNGREEIVMEKTFTMIRSLRSALIANQ